MVAVNSCRSTTQKGNWMITQTDIKEIAGCSTALWNTFKDICTAISDMPDQEKAIDTAFIILRDKVREYKETDMYNYAVGYAHDLLSEVERLLHPGKIKRSNYLEVKRMGYGEFCEYLKDPNPGDLITVIHDGENLAHIKIRMVITP